MFPSLLHKSLLYCCTTHAGANCQRQVTDLGAGWHHYPADWWKNLVKDFLCDLVLTSTITVADTDEWLIEGK